MAVAVLPRGDALALQLRVQTGATVSARVVGHDADGILVTTRAGWVRPDDSCSLVVMDEQRAGFEIDGRVISSEPHEDGQEVIRLAVESVRRVKSRRAAPRALLRESALIESPHDPFDVEVVDVGADGLAFITDQPFQVGESMAAMLNVEHQVLRVRAQVANVSSLGLGRSRVGCRFVEIAEVHRMLLNDLAREGARPSARSAGDRDQVEDAGAFSALIRRLAASESPTRERAVERALTTVYCQQCTRFTLHRKPSNGDAAWACMNCDAGTTATTPDSPPEQGADSRAAA
jgi:PilZ domain